MNVDHLKFVHVAGIEKYWTLKLYDFQNLGCYKVAMGYYHFMGTTKLICKAFIIFLLYLQVEITKIDTSLYYDKMKKLGEMKGEAMRLMYNNFKVKQYL